jgi:Spy/CpxP family protein refolding chaperone
MRKTTIAALMAALVTVGALALMMFSSPASAQPGPVCGSCWHSPPPEPPLPASPSAPAPAR